MVHRFIRKPIKHKLVRIKKNRIKPIVKEQVPETIENNTVKDENMNNPKESLQQIEALLNTAEETPKKKVKVVKKDKKDSKDSIFKRILIVLILLARVAYLNATLILAVVSYESKILSICSLDLLYPLIKYIVFSEFFGIIILVLKLITGSIFVPTVFVKSFLVSAKG